MLAIIYLKIDFKSYLQRNFRQHPIGLRINVLDSFEFSAELKLRLYLKKNIKSTLYSRS